MNAQYRVLALGLVMGVAAAGGVRGATAEAPRVNRFQAHHEALIRDIPAGAKKARVWLVVRKRDQENAQSVFADPDFRYHVVAETRRHRLISNRP